MSSALKHILAFADDWDNLTYEQKVDAVPDLYKLNEGLEFITEEQWMAIESLLFDSCDKWANIPSGVLTMFEEWARHVKLMRNPDTPHHEIEASRSEVVGLFRYSFNLCTFCKRNMGDSNPRQYCMKTYCPQEDLFA